MNKSKTICKIHVLVPGFVKGLLYFYFLNQEDTRFYELCVRDSHWSRCAYKLKSLKGIP